MLVSHLDEILHCRYYYWQKLAGDCKNIRCTDAFALKQGTSITFE